MIHHLSSHHSRAMNLEFPNHRVVLILECPNHRVVRQSSHHSRAPSSGERRGQSSGVASSHHSRAPSSGERRGQSSGATSSHHSRAPSSGERRGQSSGATSSLTTPGRPRAARGEDKILTIINKLQPLRNGMQQICKKLTFTRRF